MRARKSCQSAVVDKYLNANTAALTWVKSMPRCVISQMPMYPRAIAKKRARSGHTEAAYTKHHQCSHSYYASCTTQLIHCI